MRTGLILCVGALLILSVAVAGAASLKVVSLNAVVSDLARQVGDEDIVVVDLMPRGADPHGFTPTPGDLKRASDADLVLAAGKGLEPYLDEFRDALGGGGGRVRGRTFCTLPSG